MEYTEETIKSFFERITSTEFISMYTYWELYKFVEKYISRVGIDILSTKDKELWNRMVKDFESPGYLQVEG